MSLENNATYVTTLKGANGDIEIASNCVGAINTSYNFTAEELRAEDMETIQAIAQASEESLKTRKVIEDMAIKAIRDTACSADI